MEHPDWPAFLAAIVADPDDDTARLVAADFLEENGDADRAAFIRIQVELARLEAAGEGKSLDESIICARRSGRSSGRCRLDWKFWAAEACPELVAMSTSPAAGIHSKGMTVEGAERLDVAARVRRRRACPAEEWLRHGVAVRQRNPMRRRVARPRATA